MGSDARVFINYRGPDHEQVKRLAKILKRQGLDIFLDSEDIRPGQPEVLAKLTAEIRNSDVFLACIGPAGIPPQTWQTWEQSIVAQLKARTDSRRIIVVYLPGAEIDENDPHILTMNVDSYTHFKDTIATDRQNLLALIEAITRQKPEKLVEMENDPPGGLNNPYRGLKPFDVPDTQWFFGRKCLTDELVERVRAMTERRDGIRLLMLVGASGSGKSSLARAGLFAALRDGAIEGSQNWRYAILRPGANPVQALIDKIPDALQLSDENKFFFAKELRADTPPATVLHDAVRGDEKFVLLVDQFEEIFTQCTDEKTRGIFIENLLYAVNANHQTTDGSVIAVLTLRTDFSPLLADFPVQGMRPAPNISIMIDKCQKTIASMTADELRAAIRLPALGTGCDFGLFLVDKILKDAKGHGGVLPLLQVALQKLWNTCRANGNNTFTFEAYDAMGGLAGALSQEADKTYQALDPEEQKIARHVFLQLVVRQPDTWAQDARKSVLFSELCPDGVDRERVWNLVQKLASGGLLVTHDAAGNGDSTVEIIHEALFQHWDRLREWIEEDKESLRQHQQIQEDVKKWKEKGKNDDFLYRGLLLKIAEKWCVKNEEIYGFSLNGSEREFLDASKRRREAEIEAKRAEEQQLRDLLREKERQRAIAEVRRLTSASLYEQDRRFDLSLLLAVAATQEGTVEPMLEGYSALLSRLQSHPQLVSHLYGHEGYVNHVSFSPDGRILASASDDKTVRLWNVESWELLKELRGHEDDVNHVSFSQNGRILASASDDKTVRLWNVESWEPLKELRGHDGRVNHVSFSPDGRILASASDDGTICLWDVESGQFLKELRGHKGEVNHVSFSPDGCILASASRDKTICLWDAESGLLLKELCGHKDSVNHVSFSPNGHTLASASGDGTICLWDVESRQLPEKLGGHEGWVMHVSFSPDGRILASASWDKTIRLWDVEGRQLLKELGRCDWVRHVFFGPDGCILASASNDETVRLWDVGGRLPLGGPLRGYENDVNHISFSPDDRILASAGGDKTIRLWEVESRQALKELRGHKDSVNHVSFSPDGRILASASKDKTICLWDAESGLLLKELCGHEDSVNHVSFSPNGRILASAGWDKTIRLWDVESRLLLKKLPGHEGEVNHVSFSPDGRILASAGGDGTIRLWGVESWQLLEKLGRHEGEVNHVSFSPDGCILASTGDDETICLWDVEHRLLLRELRGHEDRVRHVSFSLDGCILASASDDRTIRLWNVESWLPLGDPLRGHENDVNNISFSPDNRFLASASDDQTIRLWDVSPESWIARARKIVNRNMTRAEWREYMGERPYRKIFEDLPEAAP